MFSVLLRSETSFGPAGTLIPFDVFDPANYFVDLTITAAAVAELSGEMKTELTLDFRGTGPGIELLGIDPVSGSQLILDFDAIADALAEIQIRYHRTGQSIEVTN